MSVWDMLGLLQGMGMDVPPPYFGWFSAHSLTQGSTEHISVGSGDIWGRGRVFLPGRAETP